MPHQQIRVITDTVLYLQPTQAGRVKKNFASSSATLGLGLLAAFWEDISTLCRSFQGSAFGLLGDIADELTLCLYNLQVVRQQEKIRR